MNSVYREHDITVASFAQIDKEIGSHDFSEAEYAVIRRVIHTTADFEFRQLIHFSHQPFAASMAAFVQQRPIVTDVAMVAAGSRTVAAKTWRSPISIAVQQVLSAPPQQTRSALGIQQCADAHPQAVFVIGNAPTALLALCEGVQAGRYQPAFVIGAPVGFINVVESKQALADLAIPHILVTGRKGGSAVAAAILNALMIWAWDKSQANHLLGERPLSEEALGEGSLGKGGLGEAPNKGLLTEPLSDSQLDILS